MGVSTLLITHYFPDPHILRNDDYIVQERNLHSHESLILNCIDRMVLCSDMVWFHFRRGPKLSYAYAVQIHMIPAQSNLGDNFGRYRYDSIIINAIL